MTITTTMMTTTTTTTTTTTNLMYFRLDLIQQCIFDLLSGS